VKGAKTANQTVQTQAAGEDTDKQKNEVPKRLLPAPVESRWPQSRLRRGMNRLRESSNLQFPL
jgi:hypothetical protein